MNYQPRMPAPSPNHRMPAPSPNQSPSRPFPQRPFYRNNFTRQHFSPGDHHVTSTPRFVPGTPHRASISYNSYYSPESSTQYSYKSNFRGNNRNTEVGASAGSNTGFFKSPGNAYRSPAGRMRGHHFNRSSFSTPGNSSSHDIRSFIHPSMLENPWEQLERNLELNKGINSAENLT